MPRNWARNHQVDAEVLRPRDEAELVGLLASGRARKPMGALHSWSDAAMEARGMVSLDALDGFALHGDGVRVGAGMRLHALNTHLDGHGLAMPILGSVAEQSVAGAISTGTHGSSIHHGNLSTTVRAARLALATGEVLDLDADDPRIDAVRVGLGALGILTRLDLDVVPAFTLAETATPLPFAEAVDQLPALLGAAEFVKLWWLPHTDTVVVFSASRTSEPCGFSRVGRWVDEQLVNNGVFAGILGLGAVAPGLIPSLNRLVGLAYFRPQRRVATSHRVFNIAMPPRHLEMEYAIPIEATAEALRWMRGFVAEHRVGFVVEVRFVRGDTAWMSPAHGRDVCQLGAYIGRGPDVGSYFGGFEAKMLDLDGRPHWGKAFSVQGARLRRCFPRADAFLDLRERLDPDGRFVNPFVQRLLA